MIPLTYFQFSDLGRVRENNEDFMAAIVPAEEAERLERGSLFVIADGLGGLPDGQIASRAAVRAVEDLWQDMPDFESVGGIREVFEKVNERIFLLNQPKAPSERMATTLTASFFRRGHLRIGHIGDCRVYQIKDSRIRCLTQDHSIDRHTLTQVIGIEDPVKADVYEVPIEPGDLYVQCSDGLYSMVGEGEILEAVSGARPEESAQKLVNLANAHGGQDNITIQLILIQ